MSKLHQATLIAASLLATMNIASIAPVEAATVSSSGSLSMQDTDWTDSLNFDKFNTSLGTLNSVTLILQGDILGGLQYENRGSNSRTVTGNLASTIFVSTSELTDITLAEVIPLYISTQTVARYDGTLDYSGASGKTLNNLSATKTASFLYNADNPILNAFIGTGAITLNVDAIGSSYISGGGNIASTFNNQASANLRVVYDYTSASNDVPSAGVPTPPVLGGYLLAGIIGGWIRRRMINK